MADDVPPEVLRKIIRSFIELLDKYERIGNYIIQHFDGLNDASANQISFFASKFVKLVEFPGFSNNELNILFGKFDFLDEGHGKYEEVVVGIIEIFNNKLSSMKGEVRAKFLQKSKLEFINAKKEFDENTKTRFLAEAAKILQS